MQSKQEFIKKKKKDYHMRKALLKLYQVAMKKTYDLEDVLKYATKKVEAYKNYSLDIKQYPLVDSDYVDQHFDEYVNKRFPNKLTVKGYSSATTGKPRAYIRSLHSVMHELYHQNKYFKWENKYRIIFRGDRFIDPKEMGNEFFIDIPEIKELYLSSYNISKKSLMQLENRLGQIDNKCLWAYPSLAYHLAEETINNGLNIKFDFVATSSEVLTQTQIDTITEAFSCEVLDWYGQAERTVALYRCPEGHYHEAPNYSHVELLKVSEKEELYELVGTTLCNKPMPLIRYKTRDVVVKSDEKCKCGSTGVNILEIRGRYGNMIPFRERLISSTSMGCLLKTVSNVGAYQLVFVKNKDLVVNLQRKLGYNDGNEAEVIEILDSIFKKDEYQIKYVCKVERTKAGKIQIVKEIS